MRILYFGDAIWGAEALKLLHRSGRHVVGVVVRANPTDGALQAIAQDLGIEVHQPPRCNAPSFLDTIKTLSPDLNLSVSYDQILRSPIIQSAPLGFVNFHAGKLPWYRGRSVINWAIINGESEVGITAHFVDEGIDTGDIILQTTIPVGSTDTYAEVLARVVGKFPGIVKATVDLISTGEFETRKQLQSAGSYFPRRRPGDEVLDWTDTSQNIHNKIRAITRPGPGSRTWLSNEAVTIWASEFDISQPCFIGNPGQVVGIESHRGVWVKTGDSTLLITEVSSEQCDACVPQWKIGSRLECELQHRLDELNLRLSHLEDLVTGS
jgi:methionyl-tRNA formyltransferase